GGLSILREHAHDGRRAELPDQRAEHGGQEPRRTDRRKADGPYERAIDAPEHEQRELATEPGVSRQCEYVLDPHGAEVERGRDAQREQEHRPDAAPPGVTDA